jgi:lipopolysaccharide/colanic/teichoic acid biosynthesis glycosyltransferase
MTKYLNRYTPEQARRHQVKPGITGWAQVNGRNAVSWEDKFRLDVWYVDNWSLYIDLKIILKSFALVFKRTGVTQDGRATVDEFMGTEQNEFKPR